MIPRFLLLNIASASSFIDEISFPSIMTEPLVGWSIPPIMFISVDFPEPEAPMIATNSPLSTEKET